MVHDMTTGSPAKLILKFSLPFFFGSLFQQLYSTVDMLIVGRLLGSDALAAVGATGNMCAFIIWGACGAMTGFSAVTAQRLGAKDSDGVKVSFFVSLVLMAAISLILTPLSMVFHKPILLWMKTPQEILGDASSYVFVILAGTVFTMCYNLLSGMIRAMGNSKIPFYSLVLSSVVNIVLDVFFIAVVHTGVWGAALATVISQVAACIFCAAAILKKFPDLIFSRQQCIFDKIIAGRCLRIGIPMFFQNSLISGGGMIGQSAINLFGTAAIAATTAVGRIINILFGLFNSVGAAMVTYVNQNAGAGNIERIHRGVKVSCFISVLLGAFAALVMLLFGKNLVLLFVSGDKNVKEIVQFSVRYILFMVPAFLFVSPVEALRNTMHGIGISIIPVIACAIELVTRTTLSLVTQYVKSYTLVCLIEPSAWTVAVIPLAIAYAVWYWKNIRTVRKRELDQQPISPSV